MGHVSGLIITRRKIVGWLAIYVRAGEGIGICIAKCTYRDRHQPGMDGDRHGGTESKKRSGGRSRTSTQVPTSRDRRKKSYQSLLISSGSAPSQRHSLFFLMSRKEEARRGTNGRPGVDPFGLWIQALERNHRVKGPLRKEDFWPLCPLLGGKPLVFGMQKTEAASDRIKGNKIGNDSREDCHIGEVQDETKCSF